MTYLSFNLLASAGKTGRWDVRSTAGGSLGVVRFYPQWRKFVFEPAERTLYDHGCLREIADFCERQSQAWRQSIKERNTSPQ
jgi:hypothetical protein